MSAGELVPGAAAALAVAGYLMAAARLRRRGDAWPWPRDAAFAAGGLALLIGASGDLPGRPFTAHVGQHLLIAMLAPLLLVLARPGTLALRCLSPGRIRRRLLTIAHGRATGWLVFPPLAALLDAGSLWLLYRTSLFATSHDRLLLHAAIHLHAFTVGSLFAFAVGQRDPVRRRWSVTLRAATLVGVAAAHAVLAQSLYLTPPPGTSFDPADVRSGSVLMYYGGDLVELALGAALGLEWYAAAGRRSRRSRRLLNGSGGRPGSPSAAPGR